MSHNQLSQIRDRYDGIATLLSSPEALANPESLSDKDLSLVQSHVYCGATSFGRILRAYGELVKVNELAAHNQLDIDFVSSASADLLIMAGGIMAQLGELSDLFAGEELSRAKKGGPHAK